MNPFFYRSRLRQDLTEWLARGWITQENKERIETDLDIKLKEPYQPASVAFAAGIVLILIGVIAFTGANWNALTQGARLLILFGAMLFFNAAALAVRAQNAHPWIAESIFFLAAGLFGANILLIAQMYNINTGDIPSAIMLWSVGALLTAWGARSSAALYMVFGTLLIYLYILPETDSTPLSLLLWFVFPGAAAALTAWQWKWKQGFHIIVLTFIAFLFRFFVSFKELLEHERIALFAMTFLAIFTATLFFQEKRTPMRSDDSWLAQKIPVLMRYAFLPLAVAFIFLYGGAFQGEAQKTFNPYAIAALAIVGTTIAAALLMLRQRKALFTRDALMLAAITLGVGVQPYLIHIENESVFFWSHAAYIFAIILWVIDFGLRNDNFLRYLGYLLFAVQLMHIYIRAFGSLLETSGFLILGGILLLAAALLIHRFHIWSSAQLQTEGGQS